MPLDFLNDPRFIGLPKGTQAKMIGLAYEDDVASDPRYKDVTDDTKARMKSLYVKDAYSATPEPERDFFGDVTSHAARGGIGAAKSIGAGLSAVGLDAGEDIYQWTKRKETTSPLLRPDVSEATGKDGALYRGLMGAIESTPQMMAPFAAGLAGTAIAGPGAGAIAGGATLFGTFGLGTYRTSNDQAVDYLTQNRPDLSSQEIVKISSKKALTDSVFEVGTEVIGDLAMLFTFGGSSLVKQPLKQTLKQLLKPSSFLKAYVKEVPFGIGSEMVAAAGNTYAAKEAGMPTAGYVESMSEAIIPIAFMSLGLGGAMHGAEHLHANKVLASLNAENPVERMKTVEAVSSELYQKTKDKDVASNWAKMATDKVKAGEKIDINLGMADFAAQKANEDLATQQYSESWSASDMTRKANQDIAELAQMAQRDARQEQALAYLTENKDTPEALSAFYEKDIKQPTAQDVILQSQDLDTAITTAEQSLASDSKALAGEELFSDLVGQSVDVQEQADTRARAMGLERLRQAAAAEDVAAQGPEWRAQRDLALEQNKVRNAPALTNPNQPAPYDLTATPGWIHGGEAERQMLREQDTAQVEAYQPELPGGEARQREADMYGQELFTDLAGQSMDVQAQADTRARSRQFIQMKEKAGREQAVRDFNKQVPTTAALPLQREGVPVGTVEPARSAVANAQATIAPLQAELATLAMTPTQEKVYAKAQAKIAEGEKLTKSESAIVAKQERAETLRTRIDETLKMPALQAERAELETFVKQMRRQGEFQNTSRQVEAYQPELPTKKGETNARAISEDQRVVAKEGRVGEASQAVSGENIYQPSEGQVPSSQGVAQGAGRNGEVKQSSPAVPATTPANVEGGEASPKTPNAALYSKTTTPSGTTTGQVESELRSFLKRGYDKLVAIGKLRVVQSVAELPGGDNVELHTKDGSIAGTYDPKTGQITLVADNIKSGDVQYVMMHEGAHALLREDARFMEQRDKIMADFERLQNLAGVKKAFEQVPSDTLAGNRTEEALAYFIQNPENHNHSLFKRIISAIKMALFRMGIPVGKLNEADLSALFSQGVKSWANQQGTVRENRTVGNMAQNTPDSYPMFSRQKVAEAASKAVEKLNKQPDINNATSALKGIFTGMYQIFRPESLNEQGKSGANALRTAGGMTAQSREHVKAELNKISEKYSKDATTLAKFKDAISTSTGILADQVFSKMEHSEWVDIIGRAQRGLPQRSNIVQEVMNLLQSTFKDRADFIQGLDIGALEKLRENYFGVIWKQKTAGDAILSSMSKATVEGKKSFLKKSVFADVYEGAAKGYELAGSPLDIAFAKLNEMDRFIANHMALQEGLPTEGGATPWSQLIGVGEKVPAGWEKLDGPLGVVVKADVASSRKEFVDYLVKNTEMDIDEANAYATATHAKGEPYTMKKPRQYILMPGANSVFKNFLSKSLYGKEGIGPAYEAYMGFANTLNQFQLGLSFFHLGFVSNEAVISSNAMMMRAMIDGNWSDALAFAKRTPRAPYLTYMEGKELLRKYEGAAPMELATMEPIVRMIVMSGGARGMDTRLNTDHTKQAMEHFANNRKIRGLARTPLAAVEQLARPVLEGVVPPMKFGIFHEMASYWLKHNPNASQEEMRTRATEIWDTIDKRMGQVVYDRLFMRKTAKNILQALIRAPGWTGGTILEVGGAGVDVLKVVKAMATGEKVKITDRMLYTVSLFTGVMAINALATIVLTGSDPEPEDLWAFRTGNLDENGRPERYSLATYLKDIAAWLNDPFKTALHKTHPLLSFVGDVATNKNHSGTEVRHPGDNLAMQAGQIMLHLAKAFVPFAVKGAMVASERGDSPLLSAVPFVGITPAGKNFNRSEAERLMGEITALNMSQSSKTKVETERNDLKRKITRELRLGNADVAATLFAEAQADGMLTAKDMTKIRENSKKPPASSDFSRLTLDQMYPVYEKGTEAEKEKWRPILEKQRAKQRPKMADVFKEIDQEKYDDLIE